MRSVKLVCVIKDYDRQGLDGGVTGEDSKAMPERMYTNVNEGLHSFSAAHHHLLW